ncbi:MAG: hypothetical protein K9L70_04275 [Thiohalocapsa sp.]|nr:hypothetical protein [Thiohalocapsa sp.]MCF7991825.1 hypothetical protein [Thiohalocapsa sp.]
MALRACRWLAAQAPAREPPSAWPPEAIEAYIANGGRLDSARSKLWRGDAHEPLSRVYQRLSALPRGTARGVQ